MGIKLIWRLLALFAALCLAVATPLLAQFPADHPTTACIGSSHRDSVRIAGFIFNASQNDETYDACLQVFRHGKLILKRTQGNGGYFKLGQAADNDLHTPAIANGTDITGRGHPDLIVSTYSGGAHCCLTYLVYELAPKFRLIQALHAEDGDFAHFERIDGTYYFVANDWTFAYWKASFAESPAPEVLLHFINDNQGGHYHLALDKMKRPPPTEAEFQTLIASTRGSFDSEAYPLWGGIGADLWGNMLTLIYDGNDALAWKLLNDTWPPAQNGKTTFLADFCSQLKRSPYWSDLKPDLNHASAICLNAPLKRSSD